MQVDDTIEERLRKSENVIGAVVVDSYVDSRTILDGCDYLLVIFVEEITEVDQTSYFVSGDSAD